MNDSPPTVLDRGLLLTAILCGIILSSLMLMSHRTPAYDGRGHDGRFYAAMAGDPEFPSPAPAPYCFRVLTPALIGLLPGPIPQRFEIVNYVAWWLALAGWYCLARAAGLSQTEGVFGSLVSCLCAWGPMNSFYNPCYIDAMMYAFLMWGLFLMLRDSGWLWLLLPVAVLQREQAMILGVAILVRDIQRRGWSRAVAVRSAGLLSLCAAAQLMVRLFVTAPPGTSFAPWEVTSQVARWLLRDPTYAIKSVLAIFYALSIPLVGVILLPGARRVMHEQRWPVYYLFVCILSLFGGSDKARLVFLAMPVLLLLFVHGLRTALNGTPPIWAMAVMLVIHLFVQFPPHLMWDGGHLLAPLIDDPDRGTHAASRLIAAAWPIELGRVAAHLGASLGVAGVFLVTLVRREPAAFTLAGASCSE